MKVNIYMYITAAGIVFDERLALSYLLVLWTVVQTMSSGGSRGGGGGGRPVMNKLTYE